MVKRAFLGGATAVIVLLLTAGLALIGVEGRFAAFDLQPAFLECPVKYGGDIKECQNDKEYVEDLEGGFDANSSTFRTRVSDIEVSGDEKDPYVLYLYRNGYRTSTEPRIEDLNSNDVNTSDTVLNQLERGTTCTLSADVGSRGEFDITTSQVTERFNDEPEGDDKAASELMNREYTVKSTGFHIQDDQVYCSFNMAELLDKGLSIEGEFRSWTGREPAIGGEPGISSKISVDFGVEKASEETGQEQENTGNSQETGQSPEDTGTQENNPTEERGLLERLIQFLNEIVP